MCANASAMAMVRQVVARGDTRAWHGKIKDMARQFSGEFTARLRRMPGKGGWTFAPVPETFAPPVTHGWGRTPVRATVDGITWDTSVWRGRNGETLLAVPKHVRRGKGDGDDVRVALEFDAL